MKTTLLTKAALCICPPAIMATTVATVPQVRSAVHGATAPKSRAQAQRSTLAYTPKRTGFAASAPDAGGTGAVPCPPGLLRAGAPFVPGPASVDLTPAYLDGAPDGPPTVRPPLVGPPNEVVPTGVIPTGIFGGVVPEPGTWLTMIAGFGLVGTMLRARRRAPATAPRQGRYGRYGPSRARSRLGTGAKLLALGDLIAAPVYSAVQAGAQVGVQSVKTGLLAKAALCVCPPAVIAMSAIAVPPVRQAVYQATAVSGQAPGIAAPDPDVPCLPVADAGALVASVAAPELPASADASRVVPASLAAALSTAPAAVRLAGR